MSDFNSVDSGLNCLFELSSICNAMYDTAGNRFMDQGMLIAAAVFCAGFAAIRLLA